jgi:hypothetical protein
MFGPVALGPAEVPLGRPAVPVGRPAKLREREQA